MYLKKSRVTKRFPNNTFGFLFQNSQKYSKYLSYNLSK